MPGDDTGEGDGGQEGGGELLPTATTPPATEDTRWRKRALDAEELVKQLEASLAQAKQDLTAAREAMDALERRSEIDRALTDAGAADMETARLLAEIAVSRMETPDVRLAVDDLAANKPFLFRRQRAPAAAPATAGASAMSGRIADPQPAIDLGAAAEQAAVSGDRAALLRYLRLRRGVW